MQIKNTISPILIASLFCLGSTQGQSQEDAVSLIEDAMCYACHQQQALSLGPPWLAIAARHANRKEIMTEVLATKIINGGGGNWGNVPMVPNQRLSEQDAQTIAQWILQQTVNTP